MQSQYLDKSEDIQHLYIVYIKAVSKYFSANTNLIHGNIIL